MKDEVLTTCMELMDLPTAHGFGAPLVRGRCLCRKWGLPKIGVPV